MKTYKGYELLKMLCRGEIKANQKVSSINLDYENCTLDFVIKDTAENIMNLTFELIEENKEIEELEKISYDKFVYSDNKHTFDLTIKEYDKINELVRAVNKLIKEREEK